jgi:uncharacterized protein (TIGR03437 family)
VSFFGTGEGQTDPPGQDGVIVTAGLLAKPLLPVQVFIDGIRAELLYAGSAPEEVAGMLQVNARVPPEARSGPNIPVWISVGGTYTQKQVTMAIQ